MAVTRGVPPLETRSLRALATFKPKPDYDVSRMRAVAFVQNIKTGEVLQAISAPVCTQ